MAERLRKFFCLIVSQFIFIVSRKGRHTNKAAKFFLAALREI